MVINTVLVAALMLRGFVPAMASEGLTGAPAKNRPVTADSPAGWHQALLPCAATTGTSGPLLQGHGATAGLGTCSKLFASWRCAGTTSAVPRMCHPVQLYS